ncbi:MAG TPA: hypothetical protein VMV31_04325 [Terriglobales bacterium]|nr:hypothetical protein [Terriglobales bacterium]
MAVIKRVGLGSAFKITLCLYFLIGIIMAVLAFLTAQLVGTSPLLGTAGPYIYLVLPLAYGLFGAVAAVIVGFFYNLVAGWVGGLKIELE